MEDTFKIIGLVATDEEDVESQFFFFVPFFGSVKWPVWSVKNKTLRFIFVHVVHTIHVTFLFSSCCWSEFGMLVPSSRFLSFYACALFCTFFLSLLVLFSTLSLFLSCLLLFFSIYLFFLSICAFPILFFPMWVFPTIFWRSFIFFFFAPVPLASGLIALDCTPTGLRVA